MRTESHPLAASIARRFCKLYCARSGQHSLANSRILRWLSRGIMEVAVGHPGQDYICVNLADADGRSAYFFGYNDGKVFDVIRRILKPGDRAVDIGANYGTFTLLMARCVGPRGLVHTFEPQPDVNRALQKSITANGFTQVVQHEMALSDHYGEELLYTVPGSSGVASLRSGASSHSVAVRVADANCELFRGGRAKLLKIDVEGHELTVLMAARQYLSEMGPDYLIFEYNYPKSQFWTAPLPSLLRSQRYSRIYEIPRSVFRTTLRLVRANDIVDPRTVNFLAVRDGVASCDVASVTCSAQ